METVSEKKNLLISVLFYIVLAFLCYLSIKYIASYLLPFLIGFLLSMSVKNPSVYLSRKIKIKQKYISFCLLIVIYSVLVLAFYFLSAKIVAQTEEILEKLPQFFNLFIKPVINGIVERLSQNNDIRVYVSSALNSVYERLSSIMITGAGTFLSSLPNLILSLVFTVISSFFFSADYYGITNYVSKLVPKKYRNEIFKIKSVFTGTILKMIKGYGLIVLITFSELFLGLTLLKVEDALVFSALIAVLDILPIIGSGTFLIPAAIISIFGGRLYLGIGLIFLFLIVTVIRNIIEPKIIGNHIGLHPIIMLLSIYLGGKLFGLIGIISLPIIITVIKAYTKNEPAISK